MSTWNENAKLSLGKCHLPSEGYIPCDFCPIQFSHGNNHVAWKDNSYLNLLVSLRHLLHC